MAFLSEIYMAQITLEQLKAENAEEPKAADDLTPEEETAKAEEAAVVAAALAEGDDDQDGDLEKPDPEGEADDEPVEAWMQTEGQTSDDQQHKGPSFRGLKQKLKAKIGVKDDEIADLRAEIDALKSGTVTTAAPQERQPKLPPRPKRDDFNLDDDAYDAAVDAWNDAKLDARLKTHTEQQQQTQAVNSQQQSIDKAVDQHYENAAKLVADGKVTEEQYRNADELVRSTIESVLPRQGDIVADFLISRLNSAGEGSEKVWFHLGRNPAALATLKSKMANDPNGIDAAMYLGDLRGKLTADPAKRVSQAPKPGSRVKGDAKTINQTSLQKQYSKAGDDVQKRIDLKREAKAKGEDTSNWS